MPIYPLSARVWFWLVLLVVLGQGPAIAREHPLKIGGTGWSLTLAGQLGAGFRQVQPDTTLEIAPSLGSTGGIRALLAGVLEVAFSSRPLNPKEQGRGVEAIEVARTPLVLATSYGRGDRDLSLRDVVAVFRLQRLKWADGTPIRIVLRPMGETDTAVLGRATPEMADALAIARGQPAIPVAQTDDDNLALLGGIDGSFGFVALTSALLDAPRLNLLPLEGVAPTLANLASGAYRPAKPLYLIVAVQPAPRTRAFVQFVRSPAGRRILEQAGCLPTADAGSSAKRVRS